MTAKINIGKSTLEVVQGDITFQDTEAIGNAANSALAGGGGVDGAIHRAGGPSLMAELKARYKGCPTGSAVMTGGGNLKAKYVILCRGSKVFRVSQRCGASGRCLSREFGVMLSTEHFLDRLPFFPPAPEFMDTRWRKLPALR